MRSFRRKFLLILVCIPFHMQAGTGVSDTLKVYFRQNEKQWNQDYRYNGLRLEQFLYNYRRLREEPIFRSKARIHIYSGCSPEGRYKSNMRLLGMRVESLKSVLVEKYDIPDSLIVEDFRGINWERLSQMVIADPAVPFKDEVLTHLQAPETVVNSEGKLVEVRKLRLIYLRDSEPWEYMYEHFFPHLRHFEMYFGVDRNQYAAELHRMSILIAPSPAVAMKECTLAERLIHQTYMAPETKKTQPKKSSPDGFCMGIKTNLLYDVLLTPNLGLEFHLGRRWSLGMNGMFAWWNYEPWHWYHRIYGGDVEIRRWMGPKSRLAPLQGWHIGIYGHALSYDFSFRDKGLMGDRLSYAGGLAVGYSAPVTERMNIDFTVNLGYFTGEYKEYFPDDGEYVWKSTVPLKYYGLTGAQISLVWLLERR